MFKSIGILKYGPEWKMILAVDQDLSNYYRALIPKSTCCKRPSWPAHMTIVRQEFEVPLHKEHWMKYNGMEVAFDYLPIILNDEYYFWLNAWSKQLEQIRIELGLTIYSRWVLPPKGFTKNFHITIANKG